MNRNLVNSKIDKYRERGKGTYTFCQVGCDCNIAVNLLEKCENLQSKIDKANEILNKLCIYGYGQVNCRPIKNTTKQEVYNAMYEIKNVLKEVENVKDN